MKWGKWTCWIFACLCFLFGCKCKKTTPAKTDDGPVVNRIDRPDFSSDSAYSFIEHQVAMGPRTPGSDAHQKCAKWLEETLISFGAAVTVQEGHVKRFDDVDLPMYNIIASFNKEKPVRLLLCAHWDTRFLADQDIDNQESPIPGANDGGSGVGVLLEIARQLQIKSPDVGVDIVLFDVEDQGQPDGVPFKPDTYCLGSQYWAKNPHISNYKAKSGILLDMVGAENAVFSLEGTSMSYANEWMRTVWDTGIQLGHSKYFSYERTTAITDDHLYINRSRQIPTIDIIHHDFTTRSGFGTFWHTHNDKLEGISKTTLQAVGETVLTAVYEFK